VTSGASSGRSGLNMKSEGEGEGEAHWPLPSIHRVVLDSFMPR